MSDRTTRVRCNRRGHCRALDCRACTASLAVRIVRIGLTLYIFLAMNDSMSYTTVAPDSEVTSAWS